MISTKAERNQEMMELLTAELKRDPDIDLITLLRKMYKEVNPPAAKTSNLPGHWVSVGLVSGPKTAQILFPLSNAATNFMARYIDASLIGGMKINLWVLFKG